MSTKKDLRFDPATLDVMQEPLTVRVEKMRGSQRTPIDLPIREPELAPGMGWDKSSIYRLESWLVNEWSGGGFYNFTVTDQGGKKMEWQSVYPPSEFPEKVPPTMQNATSAAAAAKAPPPAALGPMGMWPPPGFSYAPANYGGQLYPQQQAPQQAPMQIILPQAAPTPTNWSAWAPPPPTTSSSPFGNGHGHGQHSTSTLNPAAPTPPPYGNPQRGSMIGSPMIEDFARRSFDDYGSRRRRFDEEDSSEKKDLERRAREMEERLRAAERAQLEAQHQRDLERQQQQAQQQLEQLRAQVVQTQSNPEMEQLREERARIERERERNDREQRERTERERIDRQFADMMQLIKSVAEQRNATPGVDPGLAALQEQQKTLQEELRRERERAERERVEREREERLREEIRRRDEDNRRRDEEQRRREELLQQQLTEMRQQVATPRGPDPILQMMQESNRVQFDGLKEIMRSQADSASKLQSFMLSPRDILAIQKDNSSGLDELKRNVVDVYKDVFDMQRELMAQAAQLQSSGGESPTMRILEEGIKRATGLADRYFNVKKVEAIGQAKAQEAAITAQAMREQSHMQAQHAWQVQQARLAEQAQREAETLRVMPTGTLNGTDGASAAVPIEEKRRKIKRPAVQSAPTQPTDNGNSDPETGQTAPIAKVIPLRRLGRTDEEWFGPALPHVKQLREAVGEYLKSLQADPPRVDPKTGEIIGASAEQSIEFLMRAVNYVMARNQQLAVPAIGELFLEDRFPELMDILIPDAPQPYRDHCVQIILAIAKQMQDENSLSLDEDDEDGDDETDE